MGADEGQEEYEEVQADLRKKEEEVNIVIDLYQSSFLKQFSPKKHNKVKVFRCLMANPSKYLYRKIKKG